MNDAGFSDLVERVEKFKACVAKCVADSRGYNLGTVLRLAREHNAYWQLPEEDAQEIAEQLFEEGRKDDGST